MIDERIRRAGEALRAAPVSTPPLERLLQQHRRRIRVLTLGGAIVATAVLVVLFVFGGGGPHPSTRVDVGPAATAPPTSLPKPPIPASRGPAGLWPTAKPGPIYAISRLAANFWVSIKEIKQAPDFTQIIDASYQEKVM